MNNMASQEEHPGSWLWTLIGAAPFLLLGPLQVWAAYPSPHPAWGGLQGISLLMSSVYPLVMLIGLAAGWRAKWPRWSFPYLAACALMLDVQIGQLRNWTTLALPRALGPEQAWLLGQAAYWVCVALFVLVLVLALALIGTGRWLRPLYMTIRRDSTQLSFGFLAIATFVLSVIDYDSDPRLTAAVLLPGIVILLSAVVYLRSVNKRQRIWSLALGLLLAVVLSTLRQAYYLFYGLILAGLVFVPALIGSSRPQSKTMLPE